MVEDKVLEAMVEVGKDAVSDIVHPTSQSIGENLGLLVDGVMGWLGYWGKKQEIKREVYLNDYKKRITEKVAAIPEEKLKEPEIRVVGPAVEASKYYIEQDEFREMFATLIGSACNTEKAPSVHPAFPEIIKQLSPLDARFLQMFKQSATYPCAEIYVQDNQKLITPYPYMVFDFKKSVHSFSGQDQIALTETVDNLVRLGLILKNSNVIELNFDYNTFYDHWFYKGTFSLLPADSEVKMRKYRIELTELGKNFTTCCF